MVARRKAPVVLATVLVLAIAGTAFAAARGTVLRMGLSNVLTGNYITSFAATVLNAPAVIIRNNSTTAASSALRVWAPYGGVPLELYAKAGAAPMRVNSAVKVTNLNADRLDGLDSSQFRTVNVQPFGGLLGGGASYTTGFGPSAGLQLPDSGVPSFSYGFTVPRDYAVGTALTLRLLWHTSATNCGAVLPPNYISVARNGSTHIIGPGASTGLTAVGGDTSTAPGVSNQSSLKLYTITSPVAANPLRPGDSIIFGIYRNAGNPSDTCAANVTVQGVSIIY
jgi:hypothetical protein